MVYFFIFMEKEKLFKLLRLRVPHSYASLSSGEHGRNTFFKESVDLLENFSNFFEDIRSHRNPVLEKFLNTHNGGHEFDQDTFLYFSKLVADTLIYPDSGYMFSQMTTSAELMERVRNIQNASAHSLHLDESDPYAHSSPNLQKVSRRRSDTSFPLSQIEALKEWIKENQKSISWNVEVESRPNLFEHNYLCTEFDSLISQNLELNVLCLDINLKNSFNSPEHEFIRINLDYITKIQTYLNRFPDFLNGLFKWESDHQHGLNLHCILFFKGKKKLSSKKIIEKLTDSISRDKFDSGVAITNWLNLSKQITKHDFTKISYHQTELIHQFKYWILGYYAYIDHIIKLDYRNNRGDLVLVNGDFLRLDEFVYYDPLLAYQRNIEQWKKRIEGKNPEKVWQYQNLPTAAVERIEIAQLMYEEYACIDNNFKGLAEVGVRLEIFIENVLDYTLAEEANVFLEGTGSIILDRVNEKAYCALSPRAEEELFIEFCEDMEYTPVIFTAFQTVDGARKPIYHTNVMMCIGDTFAVICADCIDDKKERKMVLDSLRGDEKEIILITEAQLNNFAGNMLEVIGANERRYLVMSTSAYQSLTKKQIAQLEEHLTILKANLDTIEACGGGSARCMMAEIFLPKSAV